MDKELQEKLLNKYYKIFRQKDLSIQESCMAFGICTGNGWYSLLDTLCYFIQENISGNYQEFYVPQLEADQVKTKFGSLRFYYTWVGDHEKAFDDYTQNIINQIEGAIHFAEWMSRLICEECGKPAEMCIRGGWYATLCPDCRKKDGYVSCKEIAQKSNKKKKA